MAVLLVTNDDGVHAAGLAALAEALAELGEVWVVAPEREQSACGHALTLHRPVRAVEVSARRFAVNGTPSDCVNLGVLGFLPEAPVLVASGINHGGNPGGHGLGVARPPRPHESRGARPPRRLGPRAQFANEGGP